MRRLGSEAMRTMIAVKIDAHVCTMCVGDVVIGAGVQRGGRERPDARLAALAWLAGWLAGLLACWLDSYLPGRTRSVLPSAVRRGE